MLVGIGVRVAVGSVPVGVGPVVGVEPGVRVALAVGVTVASDVGVAVAVAVGVKVGNVVATNVGVAVGGVPLHPTAQVTAVSKSRQPAVLRLGPVAL